MKRTFLGLAIASVAAVALASTDIRVFAQAVAPQGNGRAGGAPPAPAPPLKHTSDGQPDIQGYWTEKPGGPEAVNVETALQTADSLRVTGWTEAQLAARIPVSAIIDTKDGRIPYQPWAQKRHQEILSRYGGDDSQGTPQTIRDVTSELLCVIGVPRLMYFADFQLVQIPGYVVMQWERSSDYRIVPLQANLPHLPEQVKLHNGDARGHWEGNTLVIETSNLSDWSWFDSKGSFHTDAMTTVERLTIMDSKTIDYKVTITDPKAFTQPWTMNFTLLKRREPAEKYEIYETACVEGERSLTRLVPSFHKPGTN